MNIKDDECFSVCGGCCIEENIQSSIWSQEAISVCVNLFHLFVILLGFVCFNKGSSFKKFPSKLFKNMSDFTFASNLLPVYCSIKVFLVLFFI